MKQPNVVDDDGSKQFTDLATSFHVIVEDINDLSEAIQSKFVEVDGSEHRLEVGNSAKHRVGGWKPDTSGTTEFLAYGLFRNSDAVSAKSKVTSTSIVVIKDDDDKVLSFDVEKRFQYSWGFGRQKALLMDYLLARATMVTISAYVATNTPQVELIAAKKCIEIMDETSTRLAFEYEGFTQDLEVERVAAEKTRNEANEKIELLLGDLDASRAQIEELDSRLETSTRELFDLQENYVTLIEDTLDELSELFNFKQEESYLDTNTTLEDERSRLFSLINGAKQRIIKDHGKSLEIEGQNRSINEALKTIKSELELEQEKHEENEALKTQLAEAKAEMETLRYGVDSVQELNKIKLTGFLSTWRLYTDIILYVRSHGFFLFSRFHLC